MLERKFTNNKASFEIYTHNVLKNNFDSSQNEKDYENFKCIDNIIKPFIHDNWTYSFVKVLKYSKDEGIWMERIPGITLSDYSGISSYNYYQAGVWLGHFHSLTREGDKVLAFTDYTVDNILISPEEKIFTAFDPSNPKEEVYYFDIISFLKSAIISRFKRNMKYDAKCAKEFMKGYLVYSDFYFDEKLFKEYATRLIKSQTKSSKIKRNGRLKSFFGILILRYYLMIHLPRVLKNL